MFGGILEGAWGYFLGMFGGVWDAFCSMLLAIQREKTDNKKYLKRELISLFSIFHAVNCFNRSLGLVHSTTGV